MFRISCLRQIKKSKSQTFARLSKWLPALTLKNWKLILVLYVVVLSRILRQSFWFLLLLITAAWFSLSIISYFNKDDAILHCQLTQAYFLGQGFSSSLVQVLNQLIVLEIKILKLGHTHTRHVTDVNDAFSFNFKYVSPKAPIIVVFQLRKMLSPLRKTIMLSFSFLLMLYFPWWHINLESIEI